MTSVIVDSRCGLTIAGGDTTGAGRQYAPAALDETVLSGRLRFTVRRHVQVGRAERSCRESSAGQKLLLRAGPHMLSCVYLYWGLELRWRLCAAPQLHRQAAGVTVAFGSVR